MRSILAKLVADLRAPLEGWPDRIAFGVGRDLAVYVAAQRPSRRPFHYETTVVRFDEMRAQTLTIPEVAIDVAFVQPIGTEILLVASRWDGDVLDPNAVIVDWRGNEIRKLTLGDGIEDVRVSADDEIWVSYFDEGVFGGRAHQTGASGLVRFDAAGALRFTYDAGAAGTDFIADAYAFNLTDRGVAWIYFYTTFPIVSIRNGVYRSWKSDVKGARALAVRSERVLLFGDYQDRDVGRILVLDKEEASVLETVRFQDANGDSLANASAYGAGDRLYFVKQKQVFLVAEW